MSNVVPPLPRSRRPRAALRSPAALLLALAALLMLQAALAATGASAAVERIETPVASESPQTDVLESLVQLHVPLPASAPAHPAACDWIQYLRFRSASGPADPMQADSVAVLMPGILEGASAFDPVARNTIEAAAAKGQHVEVWAIDRRANCLEDLTGLNAGKNGDVDTLFGYYYGHQEIDGRTFKGFNINDKVDAAIGLAQTVNDYNAVLTNELPSQPWRESHVICGGHSLGGPIIESYAGWDFDGNPATTADAGYRQCAAFIGFDTTLDSRTASGASKPSALTKALLGIADGVTVKALMAGTVARHIEFLGVSPETMGLLQALGAMAYAHPNDDATPLLNALPHDNNVDQFFHLAGSASGLRWIGSKDSVRDRRYTYAGLLGQIMDDNGAALGLIRASFGYFTGGPLQRNTLPNDLKIVGDLGFLKKGSLVIPKITKNPSLIGWANYNQLGSGPTQLGLGVTSPGEEVTDATEFARILHDAPTNFTESYFPTRLLVDLTWSQDGDTSGSLGGFMHPGAVLLKPRQDIWGGNGLVVHQKRTTDPGVVLPGYEHLDVLTAAKVQNNGQPEGSSTTFANLFGRVIAGS